MHAWLCRQMCVFVRLPALFVCQSWQKLHPAVQQRAAGSQRPSELQDSQSLCSPDRDPDLSARRPALHLLELRLDYRWMGNTDRSVWSETVWVFAEEEISQLDVRAHNTSSAQFGKLNFSSQLLHLGPGYFYWTNLGGRQLVTSKRRLINLFQRIRTFSDTPGVLSDCWSSTFQKRAKFNSSGF